MSSNNATPAVGAGAQSTASQVAQPQKAAKISHGRGGAANIGEDDNVYTDGEIVREGVIGGSSDGPYSTGRGGQANIGSPRMKSVETTDHEIIPETALRDDRHEVFHTGRGGEGNLHHEDSRTDSADKKAAHTENPAEIPNGIDKNSATSPTKSKNRWSLFGKKDHTNGTNPEENVSSRAEEDENSASKAEHDGKHAPPSHNGLGDKLKYKIFGKLYD